MIPVYCFSEYIFIVHSSAPFILQVNLLVAIMGDRQVRMPGIRHQATIECPDYT